MVGAIRIGWLSSAALLWLTTALCAGPGFYIQQGGPDGIISIEAEDYKANEAIEGHYWKLTTDKAGFSGTGAMVALPDDGADEDDPDYEDTPYVDYLVYFVKTGRHFIWIRGWGIDDGAKGHLDLDHRELDNGKEMEFREDRWNWTHASDEDDYARFDIATAGLHVISLCMQEDGLIVDKIVLTTNPDFRPRGMGPAPSTDGGVMSFAAAERRGLENTRKQVLIPVELASTGKGEFSVDYAVVGGTAGADDYVLKAGTLRFNPGDERRHITLGIVQDGMDEQDETVVIRLMNPKGTQAQLGLSKTLTYTIVDPRPVVEFAVSTSGVAEEGGFVDVPVKLSARYDKPVTVSYVVMGGTASADDYALKAKTVTSEPGQIENSIKVKVKADTVDERTETIHLKLVEARNATLEGRNDHTVSICASKDCTERITTPSRGANLDLIDVPLNNSRQLKDMFNDIRGLDSENARLAKIAEIATGPARWVDIRKRR